MLRGSIAMRLVAAFLAVSLLPIGVLAYLSWKESRHPAAAHVEEGETAAAESGGEDVLGVEIATVELVVAGAALALSILMALYVSRTLVRPIRELERAMSRVEAGELDAEARVMSNDEVGRLAHSFNRMVDGLRRAAFIRDLFGQYVTPELAEAAIEHRGQLDGQLVTCSVLFADIRDFTGITETVPASGLIEMLNRYFGRMSAVVVEEGGLVNKFGGDSLLAVFGTPLNPAADHARRAVRAALRIEEELAAFNQEQEQTYLPEIMIGVGVATGDVVAGNVGSKQKLEYTVIGDAVNLAARLQAMTKEIQRSILANAEAARGAAAVAEFQPVGDVTVRGKARPVQALAVQAVSATAEASPKNIVTSG